MGYRSQLNTLALAIGIVALLTGCGDGSKPGGSDLRDLSRFKFPQRDSEFLRASDIYGPLVVPIGEVSTESTHRPWSSWWFPVRDTYLFEGTRTNPSPLEKYDLYVKKTRGQEGGAVAYERKYLYDPNASAWEGLCNAWAEAAILENEPLQGTTLNGIDFGVGDLKALLVKSYEVVGGLEQYGQRYNGDRLGNFDDIYPDQFHRVLQHELLLNGRPFMIDRDPGVAVWNTPVFMAQVKLEREPQDPNILHVTTWLTGASPYVDSYDYVGTLAVSYLYTYDLYGFELPDGTFQVSYGAWTGGSADDHPDFVNVFPLGDAQRTDEIRKARQSRNDFLSVEIVEEILARSRQQVVPPARMPWLGFFMRPSVASLGG